METLELALDTQDWSLLVKTMDGFHELLREFAHVLPKLSPKMNQELIEQTYGCLVQTRLQKLKNYKSRTDTVYGEIMPGLVDEMILKASLDSDSVFVDMGSGIRQVVAQVGLMTGCYCYGIELEKTCAAMSVEVAKQVRIQQSWWGGSIGTMELEQGDLLKSQRLKDVPS